VLLSRCQSAVGSGASRSFVGSHCATRSASGGLQSYAGRTNQGQYIKTQHQRNAQMARAERAIQTSALEGKTQGRYAVQGDAGDDTIIVTTSGEFYLESQPMRSALANGGPWPARVPGRETWTIRCRTHTGTNPKCTAIKKIKSEDRENFLGAVAQWCASGPRRTAEEHLDDLKRI